MNIAFSKMHGLGNDFVIIDAIHQSVDLSVDQIRFIADRRLGVGCDQLLLVEAAQSPKAEFRYRIFNADGSEVEQCGNGARCFARFVHEKGLTDSRCIPVETAGGLLELELQNNGMVRVNMGVPQFEPSAIPFDAPMRALHYALDVDGTPYDISVVALGNPHAVITLSDIERAPVDSLGPKVEHHDRFPNRINVGFMQILDEQHIRLRVYERGAGETLACGSGACAAVVIGYIQNQLTSKVMVELPGGELMVSWQGEGQPAYLLGPATHVFEGQITV